MAAEKLTWRPQKILVGFDGSPGADDAVELARVFSGVDSEVLLVNVVPYLGPMPVSFYLLGYRETPEAKGFFQEACDVLEEADVQVRSYYGGSPAHVLTDIAEEEGFDLIVIGSPHRGSAGRALLGSVAQGLMHGAPVPTVAAPHGYAQRHHGHPREIAVSYDGMPESAAALRHGEVLARAWGASLKLLTVATVPTTVAGMLGYVPPLPKSPKEVLEDGLAAVDEEIPVEGRELDGRSIPIAIAEACEGADLLISGSRGYGPFSRVMIGSVSTALIHTAPCPVLIVPRPATNARRVSSEAQDEAPQPASQ
ncbi:MAG: universal stress protein [Thermoleophilia bacterium]|nr:universal stress protein [Thermoleophilia bacterium]